MANGGTPDTPRAILTGGHRVTDTVTAPWRHGPPARDASSHPLTIAADPNRMRDAAGLRREALVAIWAADGRGRAVRAESHAAVGWGSSIGEQEKILFERRVSGDARLNRWSQA
jgi:hypothetical protein